MERRVKTNYKGFTSAALTLHLAVSPKWNPYSAHTMTRKMTSLWIIFPPIKAKPQNPVSADWLLLFPLRCCVANWFRRDKSGKAAELIHLLAKPHRPPCFLHDVSALTRNWGMESHCEILTQLCDTSFFVSVPRSETSCFCSWRSGNMAPQSFGKSILVVNQWGKRAFCLHRTSQKKCNSLDWN